MSSAWCLRFRHLSSDLWYKLPAPFSGKDALGVSISQMWRVRSNLELLLRVERNIVEIPRLESDSEENERVPPFWLLSFGASWL